MFGPSEFLKEAYILVDKSGPKIDEPATAGVFLGCVHERFEKEVNGNMVRGFSYNMGSYLRGAVLKYIEMVKKQFGTAVNLQTPNKVPTPFLLEDQKESLVGRPLSSAKACGCPICMNPFPVWTTEGSPPKLISAAIGGLDPDDENFPLGSPIYDGPNDLLALRSDKLKSRSIDPKEWHLNMQYLEVEIITSGFKLHPESEAAKLDDNDKPSIEETSGMDDIGMVDWKPRGQLNNIVASILTRILYVARMARFDLLRVACPLATRISRWTGQDDKRLLRLIRYIWHHLSDRQVGFIGNDIKTHLSVSFVTPTLPATLFLNAQLVAFI